VKLEDGVLGDMAKPSILFQAPHKVCRLKIAATMLMQIRQDCQQPPREAWKSIGRGHSSRTPSSSLMRIIGVRL
jgi:hypothetical protein